MTPKQQATLTAQYALLGYQLTRVDCPQGYWRVASGHQARMFTATHDVAAYLAQISQHPSCPIGGGAV